MLVALQLVLILAAGVAVALGLQVWGFGDERAHASYVAEVGNGQLPWLGHTVIPRALASLGGRPLNGFINQSYEAFQPPLYYALLAGPWDVAQRLGGAAFAVHVVRLLDLALFAAALFLVWRLACRATATRAAALAAFAFALTFAFWPGVVVRGVTISNIVLEVPLTAAVVLVAWIAWSERSVRAAVLTGILCGLGLLCRLPFPAIVLVPFLAWRVRQRSPIGAAAVLLLPLVLIAPWLVENLHRYHALTAASVVREMQGGYLNPGDKPYGLSRLIDSSGTLLGGTLPEDWANTTLAPLRTSQSLPLSVFHVLKGALVFVVIATFLLWILRRPKGSWLLVVPFLAGLILMELETVVIRLPLVQPRYVYPSLLPFALAGGLALAWSGRLRAAFWTASTLTVALAALWIYLTTIPPLRGG